MYSALKTYVFLKVDQLQKLETDLICLKFSEFFLQVGELNQQDAAIRLKDGRLLTSAQEVKYLIVGVHQDQPVYLWEVTQIRDGPTEAKNYTRIAFLVAGFGIYIIF
jgi:hypothetical protein